MAGSCDVQSGPHNAGVAPKRCAGERGCREHALTIARKKKKASRHLFAG